MPSSTDVRPPDAAQTQRVQAMLKSLEEAWRRAEGSSADIDLANYLPPVADPLRPAALRLLIKADMKHRRERGHPVRLDVYLERFPELGGHKAVPAELVYEEFRLWHHPDDESALHAYQTRFPDQYEQLLRMAQDQWAAFLVVTRTGADLPSPGTALLGNQPGGRPAPLPPPTPSASPPAGPAPGSGQALRLGGEYHLLERLGSGAFGEVWKARGPGGTEVALKIISRPADQRKAQKELEALEDVKNLHHPYIVQTHAYWVHDNRVYIVMELAEGTLLDRVEQCGEAGLPLPELLRYTGQAAEALDFLNSHDVRHRDVKPANLMLVQGYLKLGDLGVARRLPIQSMLADATLLGTPAYMAPEVWQEEFSKHSDQWSLAVTYAELRLKRRLFKSTGAYGLMREVLFDPLDLSGVEDREQEVLRRALARNPRERYPSCEAFVRALEEALAPPPPPPPPPRPQDSLWWRRLRLAGLLLLLLVPLGLLVAASLLFLVAKPPVPRLTVESPGPVAVGTGQRGRFELQVQRLDFGGRVKVSCAAPPRVKIQEGELAEGDDHILLEVSAAPDAPLGTRQVEIRAEGGGVAGRATLELTVVMLPDGFEKDGEEVLRDAHGTPYYKQIARVEGGLRIPFVLIPRQPPALNGGKTDPLPTFYMMRDKVSLGLFRQFAGRHPGLVKTREWEKGGDERHPVLGVGVVEAHEFARWVKGKLPSVGQWNKAAGLYLSPRRGDGPYQGVWWNGERVACLLGITAAPPGPGALLGALARTSLVPDVACNLRGPRRVGEARDDRSPFDCRDMAGNGYEWTRTLKSDQAEVPIENPQDFHRVFLRSRPFDWDAPLQYRELEPSPGQAEATWAYLDPNTHIGFRVVIEP